MKKYKKFMETIGITFVGILILIVAQSIASVLYSIDLGGFQYVLQGTMYVILTYLLLKIFVNKGLKRSLSEIFVTKFRMKLSWIVLSILLPITVITLTIILVPGQFVYNTYSFDKIFRVVMYSFFSIGLSAGIVEEFIFRGLIMSTVSNNYGKNIGIVIPSVLFGSLHLLNGQLSVSSFCMLLVGGSLVGILFSLLVESNQTVWASVITHSFWNICIIGSIINFGFYNDPNSLLNYVFTTKNLFLTGGDFGMEVSVVSIISYLSIIFFLLIKQHKYK